MTAQRFKELKAGAEPLPGESEAYKELLAWELRSQRAFQAVRTKRARYTAWPDRSRKHLKKP